MSSLDQDSEGLKQPLLRQKQPQPQKPFPKLLNKRKSIIINTNELTNGLKNQSSSNEDRITTQLPQISQQVINSAQYLIEQANLLDSIKDLNNSQKRSIKVQFNKKRKHEKDEMKQSIIQQRKQQLIHKKLAINQSIYQKFQLQGLRIKSNWQVASKQKTKSFNNQIMNLDPRIQRFLYYMNLLLNTIFRLSLLAILTLMAIYQGQFKLMVMVVAMEIFAVFLYALAMIKMLYTKKDQEAIYFQKHFTDRDIVDIQMDRVLRKHFTWMNILRNVSAYFRLSSKFKTDIKISILRQQIFKRMEIVLCFIPFTVIFFTTPTVFKFQCDYPVELIVTATICLEFVRMSVHYIVIFIQS